MSFKKLKNNICVPFSQEKMAAVCLFCLSVSDVHACACNMELIVVRSMLDCLSTFSREMCCAYQWKSLRAACLMSTMQ